jgi:prevent-host-death family protein
MHAKKVVSLVEARASLSRLAQEVARGKGAVAITQRSKLAAVLVNAEQYEKDMAELEHILVDSGVDVNKPAPIEPLIFVTPLCAAAAKALTGGEYDLVLTASTISMQAVANANRDGRVVHVFGLVTDPFGAGVGISRENPLAHPRHLVGYGTMQPITEAFRLARAMSANLAIVGVAWNPAESNSEAQLKVARPAAHDLGIELLEATVESTSSVGEAASSLVSRGARALWVPGDVMVLAAIDTVVAVARRAHIPVFTSIPGNAPHGTLFDLGADYHEVGRLAGVLAAQILHGTDPATVPVTNVVPERLLVNEQALADLRDPWRLPDDVRQRAELVGAAARVQATATRGAAPQAAALGKRWRVDVLQYIDIPEVEDAAHGIRAGLAAAGLVADALSTWI